MNDDSTTSTTPDAAHLAPPAAPARAYTLPSRPLQPLDSSYARSLSDAEKGANDVDAATAEKNVTGTALTDEPRASSLSGIQVAEEAEERGRTAEQDEDGAAHPTRGESAPVGGGAGALRQRRPKATRAQTAPAGAERPLQGSVGEGEPSAGLVRKGTQALAGLLEPKIPVARPPGWRSSCINIVKHSWLNVLLVFVPVSWGCSLSGQSDVVTFVMSFIAIIPLAGLLSFATEDLALRVGETLGGLLNASFGNAVELLIAILALVKGELDVVQSSMIGSLLSNCLLVLGMCYFAGGLRFHEQTYGVRAAQVNINALILAVTAFIIPVAFHSFVEDDNNETTEVLNDRVLKISHGVAIILLIAYLAYLTFALWTHSWVYAAPPPRNPEGGEAAMAPLAPSNYPGEFNVPPTEGAVFRIPSLPSWGSSSDDGSSDTSSSSSSSEDSLLEHTPKMSGRVAILLLVVSTALTGVTAEWLVSSIEGLVEAGGVSEQFVAFILLPLAGNAAEHATAVTVATKNKLDLSMAVAIGSSIQIALFVVPVLILLGWCIGQPLTFYFDEFETVILFVSIVAVAFATSDGRTNWLEGFCLMLIYLIVAVVIYYYDPTGGSVS
ncbi:hypothetical protein JCM6882_005306 [Rhodosporidiobolus microsporus]